MAPSGFWHFYRTLCYMVIYEVGQEHGVPGGWSRVATQRPGQKESPGCRGNRNVPQPQAQWIQLEPTPGQMNCRPPHARVELKPDTEIWRYLLLMGTQTSSHRLLAQCEFAYEGLTRSTNNLSVKENIAKMKLFKALSSTSRCSRGSMMWQKLCGLIAVITRSLCQQTWFHSKRLLTHTETMAPHAP